MLFSTLLLFSTIFINLSHQSSTPSFSDILSQTKNLSSFSTVLTDKYPDLLTQISQSTSPITILAPSNAAFAKTVYYSIIGPAFSNNDLYAIRNILSYHIVSGNHPSSSLLPTFQYFPTWSTNSSYTNVTNGQKVGGVLQSGTPPTMIWTSGQSNRSPVIQQDIEFEGGTIHIVDSLLIPPSSFPATAELFDQASEPNQLTSFLGATYYSPPNITTPPTLATLLNTSSDITIFAPNNIAMQLVSGQLETLANTSLSTFTNLLNYHIVIGQGGPFYTTLFNQSLTVTKTLTTLAGSTLTISFSPNSFFVNSARLLSSDLLLANGVLHVIDNILNPDDASEKPNPSLATQAPVLSTGVLGGGSLNVSLAPFTTWLPDRVQTKAAVTGNGNGNGGSYGGGGAATTTMGTGSAATGTGKKSEGGRLGLGEGWWGGVVLGVVGVVCV